MKKETKNMIKEIIGFIKIFIIMVIVLWIFGSFLDIVTHNTKGIQDYSNSHNFFILFYNFSFLIKWSFKFKKRILNHY
jgi:hypothetical protein